jgi:hypothetical protein
MKREAEEDWPPLTYLACLRRVAGCATPTGSAGHASATASLKRICGGCTNGFFEQNIDSGDE